MNLVANLVFPVVPLAIPRLVMAAAVGAAASPGGMSAHHRSADRSGGDSPGGDVARLTHRAAGEVVGEVVGEVAPVGAAVVPARPAAGGGRVRWSAARVRWERLEAVAVYRAGLVLRARHARLAALRAGRHLGRVPYGYMLTDTGRLVPDPARAAVVQAVYRWRVAQLRGVAEIVGALTDDPVRFPPPPPWRRGAAGGWTVWRVRALLTDPHYTGRGVLRPARRDRATGWVAAVLTPAGTHAALVDDDVWRAAQLLSGRPLPILPHHQRPPVGAAGTAAAARPDHTGRR